MTSRADFAAARPVDLEWTQLEDVAEHQRVVVSPGGSSIAAVLVVGKELRERLETVAWSENIQTACSDEMQAFARSPSRPFVGFQSCSGVHGHEPHGPSVVVPVAPMLPRPESSVRCCTAVLTAAAANVALA